MSTSNPLTKLSVSAHNERVKTPSGNICVTEPQRGARLTRDKKIKETRAFGQTADPTKPSQEKAPQGVACRPRDSYVSDHILARPTGRHRQP
ncbi:hypothetical protein GCM10009779_43510 [Polymorphospora rubra]|uniref:Uncharacterized protein n=1 Tax=Polymorphospora rubra TaxID=338584 RepID=A0A810N9Z5_9ACTN|nr:hypothetical protein Prubr_51860 [Polymorphospora rubra]